MCNSNFMDVALGFAHKGMLPQTRSHGEGQYRLLAAIWRSEHVLDCKGAVGELYGMNDVLC